LPIWSVFKEALDTFGTIDVVVNCAGIVPLVRIADGDLEVFDKVIATNLRGMFLQADELSLSRPASSPRHFRPMAPISHPKAGVEGLVHVLANELRGRNITVNAVAPGPVTTELFLTGKNEAQIDQMRKLPPLERLGQPEDIANVISFLAGPDGGWVNAQVLRANGGFA
jgi:3-oxoacyl-[acyl-carrier protein] reductase